VLDFLSVIPFLITLKLPGISKSSTAVGCVVAGVKFSSAIIYAGSFSTNAIITGFNTSPGP
jgi:hypothetical protein